MIDVNQVIGILIYLGFTLYLLASLYRPEKDRLVASRPEYGYEVWRNSRRIYTKVLDQAKFDAFLKKKQEEALADIAATGGPQ